MSVQLTRSYFKFFIFEAARRQIATRVVDATGSEKISGLAAQS